MATVRQTYDADISNLLIFLDPQTWFRVQSSGYDLIE